MSLIVVVAVMPPPTSTDGTCETIENFEWGIESLKTCRMYSTVIDSSDFLITSARDKTVNGFRAFNNKKLEHLPENLGEKFPNLLILFAGYCSIREISKESFRGLGNLRFLDLEKNKIERIDDDTFDFIPAVERIDLGE